MKARRIRNEEPQSEEKIVYIRDIADVKEALQDRTGYSRYNGKENISLGIYPQSGSNLIKISNAVNAKLKEIRGKMPSNTDIKVIYDQSEFVKSSLNNVYANAIEGAILCLIILYIFTGSVSASLIINSAIPIAVLAAVSVMYFTNITVNTMSLSGLAVGVGEVVKDSILVLENILTELQRQSRQKQGRCYLRCNCRAYPAHFKLDFYNSCGISSICIRLGDGGPAL